MHVLLDTNIYLADLLFSKPEYEALTNYLRKTNSKIVVPSIVKSEIEKNIKHIAYQDARDLKRLSHVRTGLIKKIPATEKLIHEFKSTYENYLKGRRLDVSHEDVDLAALVERSLNETPPFKSQGRGFRDALIWGSLISFLQKNSDPEIRVALITNNTSDFGDKQLKSELSQELENLGLADRVQYFNDLNAFLSEFSEGIEFINDDFIETVLGDHINAYSNDIDINDLDIDFMRSDGEVEVVAKHYDRFEVESYYIYRATPKHYYLYVEVVYILEVELEIRTFDFNQNNEPVYNTKFEFAPAFSTREFEVTIDKKSHEVEII